MFIDLDTCIDCGACVAECAVNAIYLDDDVPTEHRGDIERNASASRSKSRSAINSAECARAAARSDFNRAT